MRGATTTPSRDEAGELVRLPETSRQATIAVVCKGCRPDVRTRSIPRKLVFDLNRNCATPRSTRNQLRPPCHFEMRPTSCSRSFSTTTQFPASQAHARSSSRKSWDERAVTGDGRICDGATARHSSRQALTILISDLGERSRVTHKHTAARDKPGVRDIEPRRESTRDRRRGAGSPELHFGISTGCRLDA